jgi:FAD binding domain
MGAKDGRVAIIGASMAGLLAARVLADRASEVLIIERDTPPEPPGSRKGVPQGRHAHALLRAGALIIEDLFPGLMQDLVARGAQRLFWLASGLWWQFDGYRVRHGDDFELTTFTRPFLEDAIRKRVAALPNVSIRSGISARGILEREGQVKGIVIGSEGNGKESSLDADLVVDASGRGSQAGEWLKALGHMPPPVDEVRIDMGYASRLLRREPGQLPDRTYVATLGTPPQCKRSAYLLPVEGDRWLVTLCGFFRGPRVDRRCRLSVVCRKSTHRRHSKGVATRRTSDTHRYAPASIEPVAPLREAQKTTCIIRHDWGRYLQFQPDLRPRHELGGATGDCSAPRGGET